MLSNLTDEELEEMFNEKLKEILKLNSFKNSLAEIEKIKKEDLEDVLKSLKALMDKQKTPESKEQQKSPEADTPKTTPEANKQSTPESKEKNS
ncbi:hypothetical protein ACWXVP_01335 [Mycoplasma sp. 1781]